MEKSIEEKRLEGEQKMLAWLDKEGLCYLYIDQAKDTFASLFKGNVKRPDFLVLLDSIGLIAVDAKNYTASGGVLTLNLETELRRTLAFERMFRIPVWYAYLSSVGQKEFWRWISGLKALEVGEIRMNGDTREEFIAIHIDEFEEIQNNADLGKLYTHRLPSTEKM